MAATSNVCVSLKLLIDTKSHTILFAEVSKEVVDFFFSLLSLHVGTVIRLLSGDGMVGCLGKLYASLENLSYTYLQPNLNKNTLLRPKSAVAGANIFHLLTNNKSDSEAKKFYYCDCNHPSSSSHSYHVTENSSTRYVSDDVGALCPKCGRTMSKQMTYVAPPTATSTRDTILSSEGGYVKGVVTYMIMDDLEVQPMSTISSIAMLNKFNVKDVGALEERVVQLGLQEGLKLLKASLESKTVLTDVFLGMKSAA
ncbi:PREDICTED: uncharacterized protein LOC103332687 [Prunus mume]|uniref:Uncharacterized protein LOC103332687 n=1 Tax=Prunus mume TaxID=102107 RepID=A0ABM0P300_PRUMU|nr:PREDICTED: uncharacterized protein LOC103332687 [Prunus mume]